MSEYDAFSHRTVTQGYVFPPAEPTTVPRAEDCDREQLLDLAAGAVQHSDQLWALVASRDHVQAICRLLVERVEPELRDAESQIRTLQMQLALQQGISAGSRASRPVSARPSRRRGS